MLVRVGIDRAVQSDTALDVLVVTAVDPSLDQISEQSADDHRWWFARKMKVGEKVQRSLLPPPIDLSRSE
jgi:hypothetical protein